MALINLSIVMPLYNKGDFVGDSIASVKTQSFSEWELIIVDNMSTDCGPEIAKHAAVDDSRIVCVSCMKRGPGATRNLGLRQARGKWILFLDADDLLENDYLRRMVEIGEAKDADVVAAPWKCFNASKGFFGQQQDVLYPHGYPSGHPSPTEIGIASTCWAVHAAIVRREWLLDGREWPEELDGFLGEDTAFWFRVVLNAKIAYSDYAGAIYRQHTVDCRSNYIPRPWFEGNHRSISANVAHLRERGVELSADQVENLIRIYSGLYTRAHVYGDHETAKMAFREASRWLDFRGSLPSPMNVAMRLRRLIGIPAYERIRSLIRKPPKMPVRAA